MTTSPTALPSSTNSGSPRVDGASRPLPWREEREGAVERRRDNLVDVDDASRLVDSYHRQRQIGFQGLVRRYISQILYGCTCSHCTTPTCLSCNKRLVDRPYRPPTQLTARALAHFLASQDDPSSGLCPHPLKVEPTTFELHNSGESTHTSNAGPTGRQDRVREISVALDERRQKKKDDKSLGQNLFDTVAVIWSFSRHLPSSLTTFAALHNGPDQNASDSAQRGTKRPDANSADCTFTSPADGPVITAPANGAPITTRQHSQGHQTVTRKPPTPPASPEPTDARTRIHKIRHQLPGNISGRRTSSKVNEPLSFDGTREAMVSSIPDLKWKPSISEIRKAHKFGPSILAPLPPKVDVKGRDLNKRKEPRLPVFSHLDCAIMEDLKEEFYHHRNEQSPNFAFSIDYDKNSRYRPTKPFVNRSLFYTLSNPEVLLESFRETDNDAFKHSPLSHLNSPRLVHAFRDWNRRNGALIFDSLWIAVEALFTPPPELDVQKSPRLKASKRAPSADSSPGASASDRTEPKGRRYLKDEEAAHIAMICIHALTSLVPVGWPHCWVQLRKFRSWGIILPHAPPQTDFTDDFAHPWLSTIDELEYEPALRLADRLVRAIGARLCFQHIKIPLGREGASSESDSFAEGTSFLSILLGHLKEVERLAIAHKKKMKSSLKYDEDPGWTVTSIFLEWLRTIILKRWDGKAVVNRWGNVGTAAFLFNFLNINRGPLNLRKSMFYMPYLNERIDPVNESIEFMRSEIQPNSIHLFYFPCLFPPDYIVAYFRTINFTTMLKIFEHTQRTKHLQRGLDTFVRAHDWDQIRFMLNVTLSEFLVLNVPREGALEQTLNQLWGLEERLLLKPLKVKMGLQGGEVGLDQGGVTYEFFRVVLSEAFKPDTGMFTVDPETRMSWFQPASLEPDWKFEMLGLLFSLALYNGVTLPVTFPIAFYRNLRCLDHQHFQSPYPSSTDFIKDGWPRLAKSFDELLTWSQGDVADVFFRGYSFSFEAFGRNFDVDMQAFDKHSSAEKRIWPAGYEGSIAIEEASVHPTWPLNVPRPPHDSPGWERPQTAGENAAVVSNDSSAETPLVTNANREQFVADYIFWLTYKSVTPQFLAFRKGFRTCLQDKSLDLFDADTLRSLVEGSQDIDVKELKACTRYEDGYSATHSAIEAFWSIVKQYDLDNRRKLLEFVTASDRVPITGYESMTFIIARNGSDTENLPTSSTCFGKLMLPQYDSREKMKRKLDLAIQNSQGFGVV